MAKFLITYTGGATPDDVTPEGRFTIMQAWQDWFTKVGDGVIDVGSPTAASKMVVPGGVISDGGSSITGYSIIDAVSLEAAAEMCREHPHLDADGTIAIHETIEVA